MRDLRCPGCGDTGFVFNFEPKLDDRGDPEGWWWSFRCDSRCGGVTYGVAKAVPRRV